jgi:hypothetical protein
MALYHNPEDKELADACERTRWFEAVLEAEYGEREAEGDIPPALNWFAFVPDELQLGLDEVECSLAYTSETSGYRCALWEATGEDDRPWMTFLVDDFGVRFLSEYSVLEEDADEETLDSTLERSASELPDRLESGEFDRNGEPVSVPEWLLRPLPEGD